MIITGSKDDIYIMNHRAKLSVVKRKNKNCLFGGKDTSYEMALSHIVWRLLIFPPFFLILMEIE